MPRGTPASSQLTCTQCPAPAWAALSPCAVSLLPLLFPVARAACGCFGSSSSLSPSAVKPSQSFSRQQCCWRHFLLPKHTPGLEAQAGEHPSPARAPARGQGRPSCREPTLPRWSLHPSGREVRCQAPALPARLEPGQQPRAGPAERGGERGEAELSAAPGARACREALGGCSHLRSLTPLGRTRSRSSLRQRHRHRGLRPPGCWARGWEAKDCSSGLWKITDRVVLFFFFFNKGEVGLVFFPCLCRYLSEDIFK